MNELTIAKKVSFGALTIDCYMDRDGNAYVTREAIGRALEYPHPRQSIDAIHRRHMSAPVIKCKKTPDKKCRILAERRNK